FTRVGVLNAVFGKPIGGFSPLFRRQANVLSKPDLAVLPIFLDSLRDFALSGGAADATFRSAVSIPSDWWADNLVIGDFTGDGHSDILTIDQVGRIIHLEGEGAGR